MPTSTDQKPGMFQLKQLIPPKLLPTRGKSFHMSGNEEWFIYPHGKSVYLYNTKDHTLSKEYREHAYNVGVAKISSSGRFVASGDQCGVLRVWSLENNNLKTELEVKALGGMINDLSWSEDEKLIALCGEGRDQFANVIKVDGGGAFGELVGPSKNCTSISLSNRLCLLASDDKTLTVYKASPSFKFVKTLKDHDGFVQVVRFNDKVFASAGADGKVVIYSTDSFDKLNEFKAQDSGILGMEWIDSNTLITASTDKSLKTWKFSSDFKTQEIASKSEVCADWSHDKQICGIKRDKDRVTILRLDGCVEVRNLQGLQESDSLKTVYAGLGHSKGIVDVIPYGNNLFTSVSYDGKINSWTQTENGITSTKETTTSTIVNAHSLKNGTQVVFENKIISKERGVVEFEGKIVGVEFEGEIVILEKGKIVKDYGATVDILDDVLLSTSNSTKLVVLTSNNKLNFYSRDLELLLSSAIDLGTAKITAMALSSEGDKLAVADDQRRIKVYTVDDRILGKEPSQWCAHSARIDTLAWISEGSLCSAGVDGHIMFWSLGSDRYAPVQIIKAAHSGPINKVTQIGNGMLVSVGSDSCIKVWSTD